MVAGESKGIILFAKDYKEKDKLVKIFTESYGKQMFFVKGAYRKNNPISPAILPFTEAVYIGEFRTEGLSYLNSCKEIRAYRRLQQDIFVNAYGTYILNLVDTAIEDKVYDPHLFHFVEQALSLLDEGRDPEIITNIFEVQLLQRFGVAIDWQRCSICGETQGKFDYSSKYNGLLCEKHFEQDVHRYHCSPRAIHFIRLFSAISYQNIQEINVKEETKKEIRRTIDELYDEYVGVHLKSKKFIDEMETWEATLNIPKRNKEKPSDEETT